MRLFNRTYAKPAALVTLVLTFLLTAAIPLSAADVSGALYRADVTVTNSSYTATRVSLPFTLNTQALIDGYYLDSDFSNVALQTASGTGIPFMPALNGSSIWMMYVEQITQNSSQNYILYTGGPDMGSTLYYFPDDGGMTTADSATLELSDDFEIELSGIFDTSAGADKNLVYKEGAFSLYVSAEGVITAEIYGSSEETATLRPTGGGYYHEYQSQYPASGEFWDKVDEVSADDSTTYITPPYTGPWFETFTLTSNPFSAGDSIISVEVFFRIVRSGGTSTTNYVAPVLRLGTTDVVGTNRASTGSWTTWSEVLTRPGGGSWTVADFDSLEIGVRATSAGFASHTTQVYAVVTYDESVIAVSLTANVDSGEHIIAVVSDGVDVDLVVDASVEDTDLAANVPDNANGWTFLENYSMPCMEYLKITISGTLKQHIIWENDTTFSDQSGNGHDATPTFRSTSTDPDVSAVIKNFIAVTQAAFSGGTGDDIPDMVLPPEESIDLHRMMENTDQLPGGEWINNYMDDIGWPRELFWFTFIFGVAVLLANVSFRFTKDLFPTALAPAIWLVLFASAGVVPWAALWPVAVVSIGEIIRRRVVAIG